MTKEFLMNLGITDHSVIRQIQDKNGQDMQKERQKALEQNGKKQMREAITDFLFLLKSEHSLSKLLQVASNCYYREQEKIKQKRIDAVEQQPQKNEVTENTIENKDNIQQ